MTIISVGMACVGNTSGVVSAVVSEVTQNVAIDTVTKFVETNITIADDFVYMMMLQANPDICREFAKLHVSINIDTITDEQAEVSFGAVFE